MREMKWIISLISFIIIFFQAVECSNWAQISGSREQNNAILVANKFSGSSFSAREGFALVSSESASNDESERRIFLLGGDNYNLSPIDGLQKSKGSYRNDIWSTRGADWQIVSKKSRPIAQSSLFWIEENPGHLPPAGVTYDDWISCQPVYRSVSNNSSICKDKNKPPGKYVSSNMWSPRRGHQAVIRGTEMFLLGGRARSLEDLSVNFTISASSGPCIESNSCHSLWREVSQVMNDVWISRDFGRTWSLVTPGCRAPQADLSSKLSQPECSSDGDCYGVAECSLQFECICPMWQGREGHHAFVYQGRIYVIGGISYSRRDICGSQNCGDLDVNSNRRFMNDIWSSLDGFTWTRHSSNVPWEGRGYTSIALLNSTLFILGGISGNVDMNTPSYYLNDIWAANISENGMIWSFIGQAEWEPRAGHQVILEPPSAFNSFTPRIVMVGGHNATHTFGDVWSWGFNKSEPWAQDFTSTQPFRSGVTKSSEYITGSPPQQNYVTKNSPVSMLHKVTLPVSAPKGKQGKYVERESYLDEIQSAQLVAEGIHTIEQLATADQHAVLRLRGYFGNEIYSKDRVGIENICDLRALAIALVEKCSVDKSLDAYPGMDDMPSAIVPVFGGPDSAVQSAQWYNLRMSESKVPGSFPTLTALQVRESIKFWDGCTPMEGISRPNVPGIGTVDQVLKIRDPWRELQELTCASFPTARTMFGAAFFKQELVVVGGRGSGRYQLLSDVWIRDDRTPTAFIQKAPKHKSSQSKFTFHCDESACTYEIRLYDAEEWNEVLPWTPSGPSYSVAWLSRWKGGPGSGTYILYVRAHDTAGNSDFSFLEGVNMHVWMYKSPLPWKIILWISLVVAGLAIGFYFGYLRRTKKLADVKHAMKRLSRLYKVRRYTKIKDIDWSGTYKNANAGIIESDDFDEDEDAADRLKMRKKKAVKISPRLIPGRAKKRRIHHKK